MPTRRREMQACIMEAAESKIQHKHAREGVQHSAGEMKINTVIATRTYQSQRWKVTHRAAWALQERAQHQSSSS
jgi:hypothetical protein